MLSKSFGQNQHPIILVHGFMGWGRDEMGSYRYWGGKNDIENELIKNGFEVYTSNVGPVSSNWDRAVELFYQIKGGQVDLAKYYSKDSIESILEKIKKCDLSPGLEFESTYLIQPDLEVIPDSNQNFNVRFRQDNFPLISLDQDLEKQVKNKANKANKKLKEKMGEAKWLIRAINKRNETVQNVGTLICRIQADFLSNRSADLKPLSNLELAKKLKISPSTVSRILRSKYIQTPKGAVSMKSLLASSVSKTRKVTPIQLMEEIQNIVESEKKKLSDQKISDLLNKRGFNLARRTISKYRKKINLTNSRNR